MCAATTVPSMFRHLVTKQTTSLREHDDHPGGGVRSPHTMGGAHGVASWSPVRRTEHAGVQPAGRHRARGDGQHDGERREQGDHGSKQAHGVLLASSSA
jgi:hypothetical protein